MQYYNPPCQCLNCQDPIHAEVLRHSVSYLGYALCLSCQDNLKSPLRATTRETVKLYFSLKKRGVPASFDGIQAIDIAIVDSRVNLEVGDRQTNYHPDRDLAALQQAFCTGSSDRFTVHIPSALVAYHLDETADHITAYLNASSKRLLYQG